MRTHPSRAPKGPAVDDWSIVRKRVFFFLVHDGRSTMHDGWEAVIDELPHRKAGVYDVQDEAGTVVASAISNGDGTCRMQWGRKRG